MSIPANLLLRTVTLGRPQSMASINDLATVAIASSTAASVDDVEPGATRGSENMTPPLPPSHPPSTGAPPESGIARGALIVLEGLDRSGKTTQVKLLEQRFVEEGRKVKVWRFPGECQRPELDHG